MRVTKHHFFPIQFVLIPLYLLYLNHKKNQQSFTHKGVFHDIEFT